MLDAGADGDRPRAAVTPRSELNGRLSAGLSMSGFGAMPTRTCDRLLESRGPIGKRREYGPRPTDRYRQRPVSPSRAPCGNRPMTQRIVRLAVARGLRFELPPRFGAVVH